VNVLFQAMIVASFIMSAYLVTKVASIEDGFDAGQILLREDVASVKQTTSALVKRMDTVGNELVTFHNEVNEREKAAELKAKIFSSLQSARRQTEEAAMLHAAGHYEEAVAKLLTIKEPLWKAGDYYIDQQQALRGLMEPIDITGVKWRGGDKTATADSIITRIDNILAQVGSK